MSQTRKYIFGPIPSRRLGRSLGVDVIPRKLCTLDCIYCEVGRTDKRALRRGEYLPADEIITEIRDVLSKDREIDTVTFSGSGEPTLNSQLGKMIHAVKHMSTVPVAVITNGTLLYLEDVRHDLLEADIVLPSLDAVTPDIFSRINRPHLHLQIGMIIEGLKAFRKEYSGQIWLEILLVKGYNDQPSEVERLNAVIQEIKPDRIQLNTVVRPPAEEYAEPADAERLKEIQRLFGSRCEVIGAVHEHLPEVIRRVDDSEIVAVLKRRAMTVEELAVALGLPRLEMLIALGVLEEDNVIESFYHYDQKYYRSLHAAPNGARRATRFQIHSN